MKNKTFLPSFAPQRVRGATSEHKKFLQNEFLPKYKADLAVISHYKKSIFEIGSGNGETAVNFAFNNPDTCYIACEVFLDGMIQTAGKAFEQKLTNLYFYMQDARDLLQEISDETLDNIFIFFPDPWPKKRHHKRRILNNQFLELAHKKLKKEGSIFTATDHPSYKEYILEIGNTQTLFTLKEKEFPNWWIKTKYQSKALNEGRESSFFSLIKIC